MSLQSDNKVSRATLFKSLGLDVADEDERMRKERLSDAILAKEQAALEGKTLHEIRNVDPEKPIVEPASDEEISEDLGSLPGTDAGDGGLDMGMDMGSPAIPIPDQPEEF